MLKKTDYMWQYDSDLQGFYIVEHDGMLKTGPFSTPELAIDWFRRELDVELVPKLEASHD